MASSLAVRSISLPAASKAGRSTGSTVLKVCPKRGPASSFFLGRRAFNLGGRIPRVQSNVLLHRGYFDASVPAWLNSHPGPVAFVHLDCDLYSSTKVVLNFLAPRLVPGTVILFDEYFNYSNWEQHEFKAFQEFVSEYRVSYTYLAFARQQVAVRIDSIMIASGNISATNEQYSRESSQ